MSDFRMSIGGQAVGSPQAFDVINPATEEIVAACPACLPDQLEAAMGAAEQAFGAWARDEAHRRAALAKCAQVMKTRLKPLSEVLTQEQGKPRRNALHEISGAMHSFLQAANRNLPVDVLQDDALGRVVVRRKPLGVVAAIAPWNYPIVLAVWKIAPALLAGNTVVLKPSPYTPLSTLMLGEVLQEALPPGVLNVVSGGDDLGAQMTTHRAVRLVSLTGSVATGKAVARAVSPDLKRLVLELGGNDPAIVLSDVNVDAVAQALFWGAFENSGQVCRAIKRLYVHASIFEPLADALAGIAGSVKVGNGMEAGTQLGPVNNRAQFERVIGLVDDARARGARMVTGGAPLDGPGYFYPPTLVADVADDVPLVAEEQFGPVLPILSFQDEEEVLERANATRYGLSGSVWTRDVAHGTELASRLDCGTTWVNQHNAFHPEAPLGGAKWSGLGYQNGALGLDAFCDLQVVQVKKG